ncbi:hypothetical protein F5Y18DRAFT_393199 [Xylariaceae sp. FL1019]|nr:hypothetical protein F5Y18DRAFT_393199 [Xylariaceae sp. FL1019]
MVSYQEIQAANALINDATCPRVAVFVGGTSGIGNYTIKALATSGIGIRIYLVGRKSSKERTRSFIQELHSVNPLAEIVWIEGEVGLLAEVTRVCNTIKAKEGKVDLLFLTTGYAPVGAREETVEGLEITLSLAYYCRILFVLHLLPLLRSAENSRVVSVLGGGLERLSSIVLDDLDLKKPGNFSAISGQPHYLALNTLALDKLANENPGVTFIHSWPGWVNTGNVKRGYEPNSKWAWFVWLILERLVGFFAFSHEESGQRYLFQCTSSLYGGSGTPWAGDSGISTRNESTGGVFLVNYKCDCTPNAKVIPLLREKALEKVWTHTKDILTPYT